MLNTNVKQHLPNTETRKKLERDISIQIGCDTLMKRSEMPSTVKFTIFYLHFNNLFLL